MFYNLSLFTRRNRDTLWGGKTHHVVGQGSIGLTTSTKTTQRVEHTRTQETDEGDQTELYGGRGVPWDYAATSIHPSFGQLVGSPCLVDDGFVGFLFVGVGLDLGFDDSVGHCVGQLMSDQLISIYVCVYIHQNIYT